MELATSSTALGGAIYASYNTSLSFNGTSYFINSSSKNMNGGVLLANCTFSISSNTIIYWESNHARLRGVIYVQDELTPWFTALNLSHIQQKINVFFNSQARMSPAVLMPNLFSRTILLMMQPLCYMVVQ